MTYNWLYTVLIVFGVYRLAQAVSCDTITNPIRKAVGRRAAANRFYGYLADLLYCPYCIGFWLALIAVILFVPYTNLTTLLLWWFGIAGAQTLLESVSPCKADRE